MTNLQAREIPGKSIYFKIFDQSDVKEVAGLDDMSFKTICKQLGCVK